MARTTLKIEGMHCNHCTHTVNHALEGVPGVRSARVDLEAGRAVVDYDDGQTDLEALTTAVAGAGYSAESAG